MVEEDCIEAGNAIYVREGIQTVQGSYGATKQEKIAGNNAAMTWANCLAWELTGFYDR